MLLSPTEEELMQHLWKLEKASFMMSKNRSLTKQIFRLIPLLTALLLVTLLFCDKQSNPDELYTDIQLQLESPHYRQTLLDRNFDDSRVFDMNGKLFTGTQNYYFKSDDKLFTSVRFKEGLRIREQTFKRTGEEWYRVEIDYDFESGEQVSIHAYDEGALTMESINSSPDHNGLDLYREWYPNGQLKFEMTSYSEENKPVVYQGMMTRYDPQGNILEQELYKGGELVERIK